MSNAANMAKQVVHDKLESQIKTAEAKLDMLKARTETAKAVVEVKAIAALLPKKQVIQQKFQELKKSGGDQWGRRKPISKDGSQISRSL
jgi:phage shock protein A